MHTQEAVRKISILTRALDLAYSNQPTFKAFVSKWGEAHSELWLGTTTQDGYYISPLYYRFIFSAEFAKALWGDNLKSCGCGGYEPGEIEAWEYHLQQMVVHPDPVEYLGQHL